MDPIHFSLIKPPHLKSYDRASIIQFVHDWDVYVSDVARIKSSKPLDDKSPGYIQVHVRDTVESSLLYTVVVYDLDLDENSLQTIDDNVLLNHFRSKVASSIASCVDPSNLFLDLKFKHYDDPAQGVHEIFAQSRHIISTNGLSDLFSSHEDLRRKQVYAIVNALHPRVLKDSVKNRLSLDKIDCRSDLKKFYKFVLDSVIQFRQFHINIGRTESPTSTTTDGSPKPIPPTRSITCLHCKGAHHVRQCSKCSYDEATRLLAELRQRRASTSQTNQPTSTHPKPTAPPPTAPSYVPYVPTSRSSAPSSLPNKVQSVTSNDESTSANTISRISRVILEVNGVRQEFPSAIDDGADVTIMGINAWQKLESAQPVIEPAEQTFTLADASTLTVKFTTLIDIHILTIVGPVVVRRHRVHVADRPMPDVLLGRPLLLCLGIDVEKQLCALAQNLNPEFADGSDSSKEQKTADGESDVVEFGVDEHSEVISALDVAVANASHNSAPTDFVEGLHRLVRQYVDIFRVKLGPDPPVKVPPVSIELIENAEPKLCPPRRYPPLHHKFLSEHFQMLIDFDFGYVNPTSRWASPAFCVPKSSSSSPSFRSVCDLRDPNSVKRRLVYPMPHLTTIVLI